MNFYKRLTQGRRLLYLIIGFNLFFILLHGNGLFQYLLQSRKTYLHEKCISEIPPKKLDTLDSSELCQRKQNADFVHNLYSHLEVGFTFAVLLKPILCLLLSMGATFMIVYRIARQAAFQIKHNRKDFLNSLRISIVILSQVLINFLIFLCEVVQWLDRARNYFDSILSADVPLPFPPWISSVLGIGDPIMLQAFRQLRIFIECVIILTIMTGYREALITFAKFVFRFARNPSDAYYKMSSIVSRSSSKVSKY